MESLRHPRGVVTMVHGIDIVTSSIPHQRNNNNSNTIQANEPTMTIRTRTHWLIHLAGAQASMLRLGLATIPWLHIF
jgi:hypothetical protein